MIQESCSAPCGALPWPSTSVSLFSERVYFKSRPLKTLVDGLYGPCRVHYRKCPTGFLISTLDGSTHRISDSTLDRSRHIKVWIASGEMSQLCSPFRNTEGWHKHGEKYMISWRFFLHDKGWPVSLCTFRLVDCFTFWSGQRQTIYARTGGFIEVSLFWPGPKTLSNFKLRMFTAHSCCHSSYHWGYSWCFFLSCMWD